MRSALRIVRHSRPQVNAAHRRRRRLAPGCGLGLATLALGCLSVPPAAEPDRLSPPAAEDREPAGAVLWPAEPVDSRYAVGEVRAFEFRQGATVIGHSWGRYLGPDPKHPDWHRFETKTELEVPGRGPQRSLGTLVVTATGEPVAATERDAFTTRELVRDDDELVLSGPEGTQRIGASSTAPVAVMARGAIVHEELFLGAQSLREGPLELRLVPLSGGAPIPWTATVRASPPHVRIDTDLGETIVFAEGRIERVEVADSDLEVTATDAPWPSWELAERERVVYQPPANAAFTTREIELVGQGDEPALFGEVLVPEGATANLRVPGLVFISSTGREDRHGLAGPPAVDLGTHAITDALAQAGFAVLRFDERGTGRSEAATAGFHDQVEDARRALRALLVQPEVDPNRVILVGHGEGGWRALLAAAEHRRSIVGMALLATPGRSYREILLHQAGAALASLDPNARAEARAQQHQLVEALERGQTPPELQDQAQWLREALRQDPAKMLAHAPPQLFIAQGGKDFEVDPKADPQALVAAAKRHGKRVELQRYPALDHRFVHEPEHSSPARYLQPGRRVDPEFIADLVAWCRRVVARSPSAKPPNPAAKHG